MNSKNTLSRREALKVFGAGAALLGLGTLAVRADAPAGGETRSGLRPVTRTPQPFVLPKLDYAFAALEPHIDARTMQIHYTKHHQAYVTNANKALAEHPELHSLSAEEILADLGAMPESIRATLRNNVGGHVNHSFFWKIIGPAGGGAPEGALAAAIDASFGSRAALQKEFDEAALKRFGSGWAWLAIGPGGKLRVTSSANQDSLLSEGALPVLGLDVWEHAYYLKYQNRRPDYVTAFWSVVNWKQAEANYDAGVPA